MSYIPPSVINNAIGSEAAFFTKVSEQTGALIFDRTTLATALSAKGIISYPSESLIDLINKVFLLSVNYDINFSEVFGSLSTGLITDVVVATIVTALLPVAQETFGDMSPMPTDGGKLWLTDPWSVVMSSNTTPANYVASASSEESSFEAYKAFNGTNATSNDAWLTSTGNLSGYLIYRDVLNSAAVTSYHLTSRNALSGGSEAPKDWTLEGSTDGISWTVLDTRVGESGWAADETRRFFIPNTSTYNYYKLNVTTINGSVNFVAVGELQLFQQTGGVVTF